MERLGVIRQWPGQIIFRSARLNTGRDCHAIRSGNICGQGVLNRDFRFLGVPAGHPSIYSQHIFHIAEIFLNCSSALTPYGEGSRI